VISGGKDDLWMCDLIDMVKYADWNKGVKYILLVIDVFSKYVWLRPLNNKTGASVAKAFDDIFKTSERSPGRLVSDKGQEFNAKVVQSLMNKHDILYFPTQNETKASVSERAIKTIKTKINRYFTYNEGFTYLPILQDIANSYNNTYHRTIGTTPADVKISNSEEVRLSTYFARQHEDKKYPPMRKRQFNFKIGDYVRISHLKTVFTRAYDETYTGEVFIVTKRYYRGQIPVYRLKDMQDEDIKGTFYQSELQKVDIHPDQLWKIEKILRSKGKGTNKQYLIKWKYYPAKFNSWVKATDVQ
jgi:ribosomal protein L21E